MKTKINQFENGRATVEYHCFKCGKMVDADDAVFINPSTGEATTGDGGEPFHVECGPSETPLIDAVIEEMKEQIGWNDWTAIAELLNFVPKENLIGFLDENKAKLFQ